MNTLVRWITSVAVTILPVASLIVEYLAWERFSDWLTRNAPASMLPYILYGSGGVASILAIGLIASWGRPRVYDIAREYGLVIGWSVLALIVLISVGLGFVPDRVPWHGFLALRAIEVLLGLHIWFGLSMTAFTIALRPRQVRRRKLLLVLSAIAPLTLLIPLSLLDTRLSWPWC